MSISNDLNAKKRKHLKEEQKLHESVPQTTETYNGPDLTEDEGSSSWLSVLPWTSFFGQESKNII